MSLLRPVILLGICLFLQAGYDRLAPAALRQFMDIDFMVVPVVWYAVSHSQRSGLISGCAGGLLQDTWFGAGIFGMNGFCKTFLGWVLGALSARLDLNGTGNLFISGILFSLGHNLLELGLRRLMDQVTVMPSILGWLAEALVTGFLVVFGFFIVGRVTKRAESRRFA